MLLSVPPVLVREKLQVSIADLKWTRTGIRRVLFAEKPERADSLIYCMPNSGRQIWVKNGKQWVYRWTYNTCPVFFSRLWDLCTSYEAFPLLLLNASALMWSGTRLPELVVLVFLPPACKCTSRSTRSEPQEKNPTTSNTFEGWLWSQLIMFPWRSNAMELTMNSLVVPFLPGKKTNPPLNDYTIQHSCVIDLNPPPPHISISHPHPPPFSYGGVNC